MKNGVVFVELSEVKPNPFISLVHQGIVLCRNENININMFVQFAVNVMSVENNYRDPDAIVQDGINKLQEFFDKMGLLATLSELGIGEDRLEEMVKKATGATYGQEQSIGCLKKFYWQDVLEIYKSVK